MSAPTFPALASLADRLEELGVADAVASAVEAVRADLEASIAQLDAANDELVASSAQLATSEAELRRAADELTAMGDEVQARADDVERLTTFLQAVIDALGGTMVVVDADQRVRAWSRGATERWDRRPDDVVGRTLGRLDLDGQAPALAALARAALADAHGEEHRDDDLGLRGRSLPGPSGTQGALLVVED